LKAPAGTDPRGVYLRVAQGSRIIASSAEGGTITNMSTQSTAEMDASEANFLLRTYVVGDGDYYVRVAYQEFGRPVIRQRDGQAELLLPVKFNRGEASLNYIMIW